MIYLFTQASNIGDTLSLTISAENDKEALEYAKDFIVKNTDSYDKVYNETYESIKVRFDFRKATIENSKAKYLDKFDITEDEVYDMIKDQFATKYLCSRKECYSVNDYIEKPEFILEECARLSAECTYIFDFEQEDFDLTILKDCGGIINSEFIYTGK
jgi:hypothetical protein